VPTMSGSSSMPRGECPIPKRVQSELNGSVFEASDFRCALLTLIPLTFLRRGSAEDPPEGPP